MLTGKILLLGFNTTKKDAQSKASFFVSYFTVLLIFLRVLQHFLQ